MSLLIGRCVMGIRRYYLGGLLFYQRLHSCMRIFSIITLVCLEGRVLTIKKLSHAISKRLPSR